MYSYSMPLPDPAGSIPDSLLAQVLKILLNSLDVAFSAVPRTKLRKTKSIQRILKASAQELEAFI